MEVESSSVSSARHQALKSKDLARLLPLIQRQGLSHLRIDDVVRLMGISKATFYKYFSSQEEMLEQRVDLILDLFQFNPSKPVLVMLQQELLLRNPMDPAFLMEHDLTLRAWLYDYHEIQQYQYIPLEIARHMDDTPVKTFIDKMARKISLGMCSDRESLVSRALGEANRRRGARALDETS